MQRTITQPGTTAPAAAPAAAGAAGGFFNRPGMGMLGGLAAGFLGAGLLGMMFGGGFMSGLGGFASIIGLLIQVALVVIVARFAINWWRRRNAPATASGPSQFEAPQPTPFQAQQPMAPQGNQPAGGFGSGFGARPAPVAVTPLNVTPEDYDAFERLLGDVQAAWSNEDKVALSKLTTPEMESYFTQDLAANAAKGVVNKVTDVKLLQGDLAEAWREGSDDYASVAMRFALTDKTIDRASGRIVDGSEQPQEATEIWTFLRSNGQTDWVLSAIQQA
jgi:predicted lipid-binding transport protein (Tim44 family)